MFESPNHDYSAVIPPPPKGEYDYGAIGQDSERSDEGDVQPGHTVPVPAVSPAPMQDTPEPPVVFIPSEEAVYDSGPIAQRDGFLTSDPAAEQPPASFQVAAGMVDSSVARPGAPRVTQC